MNARLEPRLVDEPRPGPAERIAPAPVGASASESERAAAATLATSLAVAPSLTRSLTRRLVIGLAVIGVVSALMAYLVGTRFATRAYDRSLFDVVQMLGKQVHWREGRLEATLSRDAVSWLLTDEGENVTFRVIDLSDHHALTSNGDLGPLPDDAIAAGEPYFRSTSIHGEPVRVATLKKAIGPAGQEALIEIGETTGKRDRVAQGILFGTVTMTALIGLAAVGLLWSGIGNALAPLRALEAEVKQRSIGNLQSLDPSSAPLEVRGLIDAINHMIGRVAESVHVQRQFLANAAHQLKTPIAGLRLQAQLALKAGPSGPAHASMVEVERRAAHSAHLIEQLLTLARTEASADVLPAAPCALADIASDVIERRLPDAMKRRIDLGFESDGTRGVIHANPVLAGELMGNLIDNSLRYGREGGQVTVSIATSERDVRLSVADDGVGLSLDQRVQVFRRFWRSDAAIRNGAGDGAGLGLAIVKEIAERYRGTVAIVSRPEFDGTRVDVRFLIHGAGAAAR